MEIFLNKLKISDTAQGSLDWYRERIGKISGSNIWRLMQNGKKDDFSDTGKKYIYQLVAERKMNPEIINDDLLFDEYLQQTNISSKAMQWGKDQEANARRLYSMKTGITLSEVGFCLHSGYGFFGTSTDGWNEKGITAEIKCPNQDTYEMYRDTIKDNNSLKAVEPKYYWQCMSHLFVFGAKRNDFIVYNPFQKHPIHIVEIYPDESAFAEMGEKLVKSNELIESKI